MSFDNVTEEKKLLQLKHLLAMTTGLQSRDSYLYRWEGISELWESDDWIHHILSIDQEEPPGKRFDYSNMATFMLSAIIQQTTGMIFESMAKEQLFTPLGISQSTWDTNPRGQHIFMVP